jgi:two-component sensor histidine kinase
MTEEPVVEGTPVPPKKDEMTERSLRLRVRQQEILAELGVLALQGASFDKLIDQTAILTADGMEAEFCKVLEYLPAANRLLVRAGVGWEPGIIGKATIGADLESPGGFALHTGKPVISNHLGNEDRFKTPELLLEHGIHRAINVILQGDRTPFGVLEVDSRSQGEFTEYDLAFLQGAANILGMAIERQRFERDLKAALARHEVLLREVDHRVKNSLQLVVSILRVQGDGATQPEVRRHLQEAAGRISAIARVHQRLNQTVQIESLDLGAYLTDLCRDVDEVAATCQITAEVVPGIEIATVRAISTALLVNELIANAAKHAYPEESSARVWVNLTKANENKIVISIRDEGIGLPSGFDLKSGKGLGMRIIGALAKQLDAEIQIQVRHPGTEFRILMPLKPDAE